ncbi:hypothetical protein GCM10018771_39400 [Streptomyces cellulosae]|nr:hypothetical protein GCM10018771_39400 [Streptomyces cellulosae]
MWALLVVCAVLTAALGGCQAKRHLVGSAPSAGQRTAVALAADSDIVDSRAETCVPAGVKAPEPTAELPIRESLDKEPTPASSLDLVRPHEAVPGPVLPTGPLAAGAGRQSTERMQV